LNRKGFDDNKIGLKFLEVSKGGNHVFYADVAQLVEQRIRNAQVTGSIPVVGSILPTVHDS
jgi:hypothetical protein